MKTIVMLHKNNFNTLPKSLLLISIWVFVSFVSNAQKSNVDLIYAKGVKPKKGLYMSFEELKTNTPSKELSVPILKVPPVNGHISYTLDPKLGTAEAKATPENTCYAVSDGESIYIRNSIYLEKVISIGRFMLFKTINNRFNKKSTGVSWVSTEPSLEWMVLDMEERVKRIVTEAEMKIILRQDMKGDLYNAYLETENKDSLIVPMISKFNERNRPESIDIRFDMMMYRLKSKESKDPVTIKIDNESWDAYTNFHKKLMDLRYNEGFVIYLDDQKFEIEPDLGRTTYVRISKTKSGKLNCIAVDQETADYDLTQLRW